MSFNPSPRKLRMTFQSMPAEFLACRDWGHDEPRDKPPEASRVPGGWLREWPPCRRCGVIRYQEIDDRGYIVRGGRKNYPEGYSIRGFGHLDVDDLAIGRLMNHRENG